MGREPDPRSRHARNGGGGESPADGDRLDATAREAPRSDPDPEPARRVYRAGDADEAAAPRAAGPPRKGKPPRHHGRHKKPPASGKRTVVWLAVILVVALAAGWAIIQASGGDDPPAQNGADAAATAPIQRLTIPEGLRREDVAKLLDAETDLSGDRYLQLTKPGPRGRALAGTNTPTSLEGFLFPATYDIYDDTTVADLVDMQVEAFAANTAGINFRPAAAKNLTKFDVVTIASMIEREVAVPAERPKVASVIYNRLRQGMSLGIDATVHYAVGDWEGELTGADLASDSPYNTRKFTGLPPGPIASPGRESIRAAALPDQTNLLYYVARNDGTGRHYFSEDAATFERDVQRSRANTGG